MRSFIFIVLFFGVFLASCGGSSEEVVSQDSNTPNQGENVQESDTSSPKEIEVLSIISDLNVRSTPGKEGVVIDKLEYGQRAIFYGEETDYKEKIIMRDIPRFSTWKKIRFSGSNGKGATDGWVYGGGIELKDEAYEQLNDSLFKRELTAINRVELSELLGLEITDEGYSKGFIEYLQLPNSTFLKKHGLFSFANAPLRDHFELRGQFTQGKLEGEIVKSVKGKGYEYISTLVFENGTCVKAMIVGVYEGSEINFETEKPSECSFVFLEKTL